MCRKASTPLIASSNAPACGPVKFRVSTRYAPREQSGGKGEKTHGLDILDDDKLELVLAVPLLLEQIGEVLPLVLTPDGTANAEPMLEELLSAVYSRGVGWISAFVPGSVRRKWSGICMTTGSGRFSQRKCVCRARGCGLTSSQEATRARDQDEGTFGNSRHSGTARTYGWKKRGRGEAAAAGRRRPFGKWSSRVKGLPFRWGRMQSFLLDLTCLQSICM